MSKRPTIKKPPLDFGGETLGERLARFRKQRGYTQAELAQKVGIGQVLVSAYETDRRQFSAQRAVRFALALDASMDEFLQRPIQSSQRYDLLFLLVLQDIHHVARGYLPSRCGQRPGRFF